MTPEKITGNLEKSPDIKREYLEDFINYRNNYIDDLPAERLMPGDENYYLYKCRGNFISGVAGRIHRLIQKGIITKPEAVKKGQEFIDYLRQRDFSKFSTQDDINTINEILDYMIKELSQNF